MTPDSGPDDAGELIDELLRAAFKIERRLGAIAARYELTSQQVMVLRSLGQPIAMSTLAEAKGCDPSNVTGIVDRIARLGLVQRLPAPDDRRVRLLSLTPKGMEVRDNIERELETELSRAFDGTNSQRVQLYRLLGRI